jgi:hypothetical protein
MKAKHWWGAGQQWLCKKASEHFSAWAASPAGKKWRKHRGLRSPCQCGYRQPDWMVDARDALAIADEEWFKSIKLANL